MKMNYLLPNYLKKIGWVLLVPGFLMLIAFLFFEFQPDFLDITVFAFYNDEIMGGRDVFAFIKHNVFDELSCVFFIIGAILIAFSKEVVEDELISKIRLESLVWATYFNYAILLFTIIFIYGMGFFWVMAFNIFTILLFFIIRFTWMKNKSKIALVHEE